MNIENKTISIVTPFFNQAQFLEETIKSVLSQAGNFYIDYIVVNDSSPDDGITILEKYDQLIKNNSFPINCLGVKFRWWTQTNGGQANAINNGFKKAEGNIWAWINSDDFYEPNAFQTALEEFHQHPEANLVYGHCNALYEIDNHSKILKAESGDFKKILRRNHSICQPAAFFTKEIYTQVNGLDENLHYALDYDLWLKILKKGKGFCINKVLANFRFWEKSHSTTSQDKFNMERRLIFKRYNGNIIDPKTIYALRAQIPFIKIIRSKFPNFYRISKKIFYFFIDKIHYRSKAN